MFLNSEGHLLKCFRVTQRLFRGVFSNALMLRLKVSYPFSHLFFIPNTSSAALHNNYLKKKKNKKPKTTITFSPLFTVSS